MSQTYFCNLIHSRHASSRYHICRQEAWGPNKFWCIIITLKPRQNGRHFTDDIFKSIFLNEKFWISNSISLNYVQYDLIDIISALIQIMAWRQIGDTPSSEPMMSSLLTFICVTRPRWVKLTNYMYQHIMLGAGEKDTYVMNVTTWPPHVINVKISTVFADTYLILEKILRSLRPAGENE